MPDTKITALTAIGANPINVATFPIPMVDLTDTSMAASGTTKKVTVNQILGAGGTATLASATITGAASAAGLSVTGSTIPTNGVYLPSANNLGFAYNSTLGMTLNSTGLGVGTSPSYKLDVLGTGNVGILGVTTTAQVSSLRLRQTQNLGPNTRNWEIRTNSLAYGNLEFAVGASPQSDTYTAAMIVDSSSNVGIGVTPSAWGGSFKAIQHPAFTLSSYSTTEAYFSQNAYYDGGWKRVAAGYASQYLAVNSEHRFLTAGTSSAGSAITFTQAMTLESTGSLVLGAAAVATTATDGFLYIPGCAGTPTGTPTAKTGRVPLVVDTTNNKLYFYSGGAWVAAN